MTDAEYAAWLALPSAQRVVLAELGVSSGGIETTRYVASYDYISRSTDTPASTHYDGRLTGTLQITESLGTFSETPTLAVGTITLMNQDRGLDSWLGDVFERRTIKLYFGDVSWPKSDFRQIYAGIIESLDPENEEFLVVRVEDKMRRLESPMTETKLGGTTPNADALLPLTFGECHNVEPVLTNPGTLEYAYHRAEPTEDIIEVRDNGIPVSVTKNVAIGRFNLLTSPVGKITASVQGNKPAAFGYFNDVANTISVIVRNFGRTDLRFTVSEMDVANFTAFPTANPQPIGLYLTESTTVRQACEMLAASVGAKLVVTRLGLLKLIKITLPGTSVATIPVDENTLGSITVVGRLPVVAACKVAYCKNWTVQEDIQSGILPMHKELFAQEWLTATSSDATVANTYKLGTDVPEEPTLLLRKVDADAEALRRRDLRKVRRTIYSVRAPAEYLNLELGQSVTLVSSKFGLSAGATGQIITLATEWLTGQVRMEVLV